MARVTVGADDNGDLTIEVDGEVTTIKDNRTSDKELFEALRYKPFRRYELVKGTLGKAREEIYSEFYALMERIVSGVNAIDPHGL